MSVFSWLFDAFKAEQKEPEFLLPETVSEWREIQSQADKRVQDLIHENACLAKELREMKVPSANDPYEREHARRVYNARKKEIEWGLERLSTQIGMAWDEAAHKVTVEKAKREEAKKIRLEGQILSRDEVDVLPASHYEWFVVKFRGEYFRCETRNGKDISASRDPRVMTDKELASIHTDMQAQAA